jgi:4-amino-4-deoxy-L-arabinose transferase-like glycosyltransferase
MKAHLRKFSCKRNLLIHLLSQGKTILGLVLLARFITLEVIDLLDPSESRYALIAQNMIALRNWTIPLLNTPEGAVPFLSKPPLHYWLTATSYSLFGMDEWTARLPSFISFLIVLGCIAIYSKVVLKSNYTLVAVLICATSPLFFFLGGASLIDMTLTAFITLALTAFSCSEERTAPRERSFWQILFFIASALAFMTKGPLACVLIGLPLLFYCFLEKSLNSLYRLPWRYGFIIGAILTIPWFVAVEYKQPGSLWYFFVNENILRYATKNYGDRYGSGHHRPYGSIWWMFGLSMLPWLAVTLLYCKRGIYKSLFREINRNKWIAFSLAWGLTPALFFTFAKQVLPAYILSGIPGISIALAWFIQQRSQEPSRGIEALTTWLRSCGFSPFFKRDTVPYAVALSITFISALGIVSARPYLNRKKSAVIILREIQRSPLTRRNPTVGVFGTENVSPIWISRAWKKELYGPIFVEFASIRQIRQAVLPNILYRLGKTRDNEALRPILKNYRKMKQIGRWVWFHAKKVKNNQKKYRE